MLSILSVVHAVAAAQSIRAPSGLRVDHLPPSGSVGSPLTVVQNVAPQFSWALNHHRRAARQIAFRLLVNETKSRGTDVVVWDTGVVESDQSVGVVYAGATPLASDADYAWTVTWRDEIGTWSSWSETAEFSTGLLAPANADWAGTAWVGGLDSADDRNQLRRSFSLRAADPNAVEVLRARCYIAAPGGHVTHLNDVRLHSSAAEGAEGAALAATVQYSSRLPYEVFDCTGALRAGGAENVIATTLGRCWFAMDDYGGLGYATIGARSLRVLITAELGSATGSGATTRWSSASSGAGWKQARGPIVKDHLFLGVVLDGRRETPGWSASGFDDSAWAAVSVLHGALRSAARVASSLPSAPFLVLNATTPPLVALQIPPIRRLAPRTPAAIVVTAPGVAIVDMGINMAGTCEITVEDTSAARPGDVMSLRHAEGLTPHGALDQNWLTSGPENSSYVFRADGTREAYSEVFTYFGFRYIEVTGYPGGIAPPADAITCWFTHTDLERSGAIDFLPAIASSGGSGGSGSGIGDGGPAAVLSALHAAVAHSALSNFHSHPTDCPSREKRGWTGDGGHAAEALMLNFDMGAPYAKWLDDVDDASCSQHHVPNIAPGNFHGQAHGDCFGAGDPGWESGFVDILHWTHRYNGDFAALARHWPAMQG
jgi:alpha-L-rhamnosidase